MGQLSLVQLESFRIRGPLTWLSVDNEDARDLWELCKDDLVVVFDLSDDPVGKEVTVPLVIF